MEKTSIKKEKKKKIRMKMKKWQIENSENSEISEKLFRVFLFPSFRFCPTAKIQNSDFKISEPSFQPGRKNCDNQGRTRWYWYRRHWRLRGFTKNSVHPWKMIKVFVDGGELTKILTKRRSHAFYKLIDVHYVTNFLGDSISSISMWNIGNQ